MTLAGAVLLIAIVALGCQAVRLARRWSQGRAATVDWRTGIMGLANAYLHTVHDVVARDPYASRMHALAAGGLLAAVVLSLPLHLTEAGRPVLAVLVLGALVAAGIGTGMVAGRRQPKRPARLSGGAYEFLPLALGGTVIFLGVSALLALMPQAPALASGLVTAIAAVSLGWLAWSAFAGPMRHALAGVVHLMAHPRPARVLGQRDTGLRPSDL
ncbi:MAG: DUF3483 domain-containing protein, partial [Devosia sp.]